MQKSTNGEYYLRSAFQFSYLLIFLWAVLQLVGIVYTGDNPIRTETRRLSQLLDKVGGADFWLIDLLSYAVPVFCVVFAAHLVRIYITLEAMEDQEGHYSGFYDTYTPLGREFEFMIRVAIIAIVSLKVIQVETFSAFSWFVFIFYVSLTLWSLLAIWHGKNTKEAFLRSSVAGLLFSLILITLNYNTNFWQAAILLLWVASAALAYDLGAYMVRERGALWDEYRMKLTNPW